MASDDGFQQLFEARPDVEQCRVDINFIDEDGTSHGFAVSVEAALQMAALITRAAKYATAGAATRKAARN